MTGKNTVSRVDENGNHIPEDEPSDDEDDDDDDNECDVVYYSLLLKNHNIIYIYYSAQENVNYHVHVGAHTNAR